MAFVDREAVTRLHNLLTLRFMSRNGTCPDILDVRLTRVCDSCRSLQISA